MNRDLTPRYRLRTLVILLAILPPLLWIGWRRYEAWRAERERERLLRQFGEDSFLTMPIMDMGQSDLPPPGDGAQPVR